MENGYWKMDFIDHQPLTNFHLPLIKPMPRRRKLLLALVLLGLGFVGLQLKRVVDTALLAERHLQSFISISMLLWDYIDQNQQWPETEKALAEFARLKGLEPRYLQSREDVDIVFGEIDSGRIERTEIARRLKPSEPNYNGVEAYIDAVHQKLLQTSRHRDKQS